MGKSKGETELEQSGFSFWNPLPVAFGCLRVEQVLQRSQPSDFLSFCPFRAKCKIVLTTYDLRRFQTRSRIESGMTMRTSSE